MFWRALQGLMGLLFLLGAWVQTNDPDPWVWIGVYVLAAVVSLLGAVGRPQLTVMVVFSVVAFVWGVWLAIGVIGQQPIFDEEGREMMGLGIMTVWMGVSAWVWRGRNLETQQGASS